MQGYLLILLFSMLQLGESIFVKTYAKRYSSGGMLMNAIIALFATLFFLVTDKGGFYVPVEMLPYAAINCVLYALGFYFAFLAFKVGPYGLTRLIGNISLMFPICYGIFFLKEPTNIFTYSGLAVLVFALFAMNYARSDEDSKKANNGGISLKWIICLLIMVVSNGFISILTRMQQIRFEDKCSNEFQTLSIGGSFILLLVIGLIVDRDKIKSVFKHGILYGVGAGICNGAKNFAVLIVYTFLPISIVSPMKAGLGIVLSFVASVIFYKEKYTTLQKIGVLSGAIAVILLSLKV